MKVKVYENRHLEITQELGTQNENNIEKMELEVPEKYQDWIKEIVFVTDDGTVWDLIENDIYIFKKNITKYEKIKFYIRLVKDEDDFRSVEEDLYFNENHEIEGEVTPEEESDIERIISILEGEITKVDNMDIDAVKVGDTATITITDKNGISKSVEIKDGEDGEKGDTGEPGYTPQKYIDYYTIADKNEIEADVIDRVSSMIPDVSNFITASVNNLVNYYLKSETYNKTEVNNLISAMKTGIFSIVSTLPTPSIDTLNTIYLVPSVDPKTQNVKDEYITIEVNNGYDWEKIGSTAIDLSGYATETWVNTQISNFLTETEIQQLINTAVNQKYTKPALGIPKTDLESSVQTSLNKADTALQSYTETDPTVPSHVKNISQADISNWNNKSDFSGDYNDLDNKPVIPVVPTNISAFTNDVGYLTQHQDISGKLNTSQVKNTNSTTAGDVYDVRYINTMIGDIETLLGGI